MKANLTDAVKQFGDKTRGGDDNVADACGELMDVIHDLVTKEETLLAQLEDAVKSESYSFDRHTYAGTCFLY